MKADIQSEIERLGPWTTKFQLNGKAIGGSYEVSEDELLLRQFRERLPYAERVLELGCMEGGRTFSLARRVGHVVGVDVRREHLQRARFIQRERNVQNVTFLEMDLETTDLETLGTFDAVHNVGLLYHMADPAKLLRQLAAVAPEMLLWTYVVDDGDAEQGGYQGRFVNENPADRIGGVRSKSFRPTRSELMRMLSDCGWRDVDLIEEAGTAVSLWCRRKADENAKRIAPKMLSVAVVVTCHNYGEYLDECLKSIVHQSRRPNEIVVIDDASTDETRKIAKLWSDWNVQYLRVEHQNVRLARKAGLEATNSDLLCFVDADDLLTPDYLRSGMQRFNKHDVGIVFSDMVRFGSEDVVSSFPETLTSEEMCWKNYAHCASLVRREALEMTRAFDVPVDPKVGHEDWLVWRKVLEQGWKATKQTALYAYRRHTLGASLKKNWETDKYYRLRCLNLETITLFVPLSGRTSIWPRFSQFLESQSWPREQTKLRLLDTSQDLEFASMVRTWLAKSDYPHVCYEQLAVGDPGLADEERRGQVAVQNAVRMAAATIYNHLARNVQTSFVWIVEDDVIPPKNAAELLLQGFDQDTASVAGPYRSRYNDGYVAWTKGHKIIREACDGIQVVEGNGFGCVMLRANVLKESLFTCRQPPYDFDPAFYERLKQTGFHAKLNWEAECEHLDATSMEKLNSCSLSK